MNKIIFRIAFLLFIVFNLFTANANAFDDCRQAIGKLTMTGKINGKAFKLSKVPFQYMLCFKVLLQFSC